MTLNDILSNKEIDILLEAKTPGEAAIKHSEKPKSNKKVSNLINQLGYEYSFVFIFAPAVKALYPIIEYMVQNMDVPKELTKENIVYLTICALGIVLNEPKSKYKAILDKVKEEGIYILLKPLTNILEGFKKLFSFIAERIGKVIKTFPEMFAYTALFVPFAMTFKEIIQQDTTTATSILDALATNSIGKLLSTGAGVGIFAVKHFMEDIVNKLKSFKDKGIKAVKSVINKIKSIDLSSILPKQSKEPTPITSQNYDIEGGPKTYLDRMFNERKVIKYTEMKKEGI